MENSSGVEYNVVDSKCQDVQNVQRLVVTEMSRSTVGWWLKYTCDRSRAPLDSDEIYGNQEQARPTVSFRC
jgi:hypothetical protein